MATATMTDIGRSINHRLLHRRLPASVFAGGFCSYTPCSDAVTLRVAQVMFMHHVRLAKMKAVLQDPETVSPSRHLEREERETRRRFGKESGDGAVGW